MELGDDYPDDNEIALLMKTHAASVAGLDNCHPGFRSPEGQE